MSLDWRVFYAHARSLADEHIDEHVALIRRQLTSALAAQGIDGTVEVTSGRDDWHDRGNGNWREWPASISERVFGEARYNLIVVPKDIGTPDPEARIGRGTAEILQAAESRLVPVRLWDASDGPWVKGRTFFPCAPVETLNPNNWKSGWLLRADPGYSGEAGRIRAAIERDAKQDG